MRDMRAHDDCLPVALFLSAQLQGMDGENSRHMERRKIEP
jgi:hypothetical protein